MKFWKYAGLITFELPKWMSPGWFVAVHLGVKRECQQWGHYSEWCHGPIHTFGLGPILLVSWIWRY